MLPTPEQGMKGSMSWTSPFGNAVLVFIFLLYVNLVVDKSFLQNRKKITFFQGWYWRMEQGRVAVCCAEFYVKFRLSLF